MVEEKVENELTDIDCIDTIHDDVLVTIPEEGRSREHEYEPVKISADNKLSTGNILGQVFNLIAQIREKEYWKLDTTEIKSLNNTCPKIIPKIVSENSGIIGCILSILGIIVKRLKLEREDTDNRKEPEMNSTVELSDEPESLIGSRSG